MRTGTEYLTAESDWHGSLSDAENECLNRIEDAKASTITTLESEGKEIIGVIDYALDNQSEQSDEGLIFQVSTSSEINWEKEYDTTKSSTKHRLKSSTIITDIEEKLKRQIARSGVKYDRLSLFDLYIQESDVRISKEERILDSSYSSQSFVIVNNLPTPIKKTFRIELTESLGESIKLTKSARYSTSAGVKLQYKVFTADMKSSYDLSTSETSGKDFRSVQKFTDDFTVEVPAFKKYTIKVNKKINNASRLIEGFVKVDGKVKLSKSNYRCRGDWPLTRCGDEWSSWVKRISDVISPAKISISGILNSSTWDIDYEVSYSAEDIDPGIEGNAADLNNVFPNAAEGFVNLLEQEDNILELPIEEINQLERNSLINWRPLK